MDKILIRDMHAKWLFYYPLGFFDYRVFQGFHKLSYSLIPFLSAMHCAGFIHET